MADYKDDINFICLEALPHGSLVLELQRCVQHTLKHSEMPTLSCLASETCFSMHHRQWSALKGMIQGLAAEYI